MARGSRRRNVRRFTSLAALLGANLKYGTIWELRGSDGDVRMGGSVDSDNTLQPNPLTGQALTAADIGDSSLWTAFEGTAATYSSAGVVATASTAGDTAVQLQLGGGYTARTTRGWVGSIELTTVTNVATNFYAAVGWGGGSAGGSYEEEDFRGVGVYYNGTQWRTCVVNYNHNGGTPATVFNAAAADMATHIGAATQYAGHVFYFDGLAAGARSYPRVSSYEPDNTLISHGSLGTLEAIYGSLAASQPLMFRASVPGGAGEVLVARLSTLQLPLSSHLTLPVV